MLDNVNRVAHFVRCAAIVWFRSARRSWFPFSGGEPSPQLRDPPLDWAIRNDKAKLSAWYAKRVTDWSELVPYAGKSRCGVQLDSRLVCDSRTDADRTDLVASMKNVSTRTVELYNYERADVILRDSDGKIVTLTEEGLNYFSSPFGGTMLPLIRLKPGHASGFVVPLASTSASRTVARTRFWGHWT